eukprot:COSAG01_NODE_38331_length_491_cov_0.719388_1_plen_141_part_01
MHGTVDARLCLPAAQVVHFVAELAWSVFVTAPGAQTLHTDMFEAIEYLPGLQAVQLIAPATGPVSVMEPARHRTQAMVDTAVYFPGAQDVQMVPPVPVPLSVMEPAPHAMQLKLMPAPSPAYVPAEHAPLQSADVPLPLVA